MKQNEEVALQLPSSYTKMSEEEMRQVVGGLTLRMSYSYLNQSTCLDKGKWLVKTYGWNKVTALQLAKEIYGHAYVYYCTSDLSGYSWYKSIYASAANGIDVENRVDDRQWAFEIIWAAFHV